MRSTLITASAALAVTLASTTAMAAVSYGVAGSTYTQNFSSVTYNTNAASESWTNDATVSGWYNGYSASGGGTETVYQSVHQNNGNLPGASLNLSTGGNAFKAVQRDISVAQDGTSLDGDTRLGWRTGSAPANGFVGLRLTNSTANTLNSFTLQYEAAQFFAREGAQQMWVQYSFNATSAFDAAATWTKIDDLTYTAPYTSVGVNKSLSLSEVDASVATLTDSVSDISWNSGTDLWIRWASWRDLPGGGYTGYSHVLTIDDVAFTAVPEPASLALLGMASLVGLRRRR